VDSQLPKLAASSIDLFYRAKGIHGASLDVRLDFHSSSPVRSRYLSYDDERPAIGFDVSVHRLSPGKAGMSG
jgi:hypothetical protein